MQNEDEIRAMLLVKERDEARLRILAYEAFIRRAATFQHPFMMKGSYVTRQYFANLEDRFPRDLDWVYTGGQIDDVEKATELFSSWIQTINNMKARGTENFVFQTDFEDKKEIWEAVDYSMSWDKPTISTYYSCFMDNTEIGMGQLDISYNVPVEMDPVPLTYRPLQGEPFIIPRTVPLPLQISWKLHQTIVRPRFKDIFDLVYLLQHPSYTRDMVPIILKALIKECDEGNVAQERLDKLLSGDLVPLFNGSYIFKDWQAFRLGAVSQDSLNKQMYLHWPAADITNPDNLPATFKELRETFYEAMQRAGITGNALHSIPFPARWRRW